MLVSHESPICMLEHSLSYNDYDYALVHLFETNPNYYHFFKYSLTNLKREVLLDNSIFELKTAFEAPKFARWVEKLQPTFYIVPDALEDSATTINNFKKWQQEYNDLPGLKIGAVQGKTYQEIVDCYKFMAENADYIAISFDFSYYQITAPGKTKLERYANGRQRLINTLVDDGVWCHTKPHHLLGASLPTEFRNYKLPSIRSIDTSNPVVHGIEGNRYVKNLGLNFKSSQLLANLIDTQLTQEQIDTILFNCHQFKDIIKS